MLAIAVLLFFHTGMLFVGWGWHITNAETIPALRWPMDIAHRLRMPLLFVIAGAGLWFAAQRRSAAELLAERTQRLLLPAVAGMFLSCRRRCSSSASRAGNGAAATSTSSFSACCASSRIPRATSAGTTCGSSSTSICTCCCCCPSCAPGGPSAP